MGSGETAQDEAQLRALLSITQKIERGEVEEARKEMGLHPDLDTALLPFPAPVVDEITLSPLIYAAVKASTYLKSKPNRNERAPDTLFWKVQRHPSSLARVHFLFPPSSRPSFPVF